MIVKRHTDYTIRIHEKTKLLCFVPNGQKGIVEYWQTACPLTMASLRIPFSLQADHVGILRNSSPGNMASVLCPPILESTDPRTVVFSDTFPVFDAELGIQSLTLV